MFRRAKLLPILAIPVGLCAAYYRFVGLVDAVGDFFGAESVERTARDNVVSLTGRFGVEACRTGCAVEDLAIEIIGSKVEYLDVLLVGAFSRDYLI
jgi:hypothetical protein